MCTPCLDYLNRRKADADDPTLGNWPARGWPALEDLEEMRRRCPRAMYSDDAALAAAFTSWAEEDEIYRKGVLWGMEREQRIGK